jgi:hypothetical protein
MAYRVCAASFIIKPIGPISQGDVQTASILGLERYSHLQLKRLSLSMYPSEMGLVYRLHYQEWVVKRCMFEKVIPVRCKEVGDIT